MKFSIITVCLNPGDDLLQTINSVLEQSFPDFEIIVKDGGSTDGVIQKIPNDKRIKVIVSKDKGIYDAMNQAVSYVTGDYIIFINSGDMIYCNQTLEQIHMAILSDKADFYYGRCYNHFLNVKSNSPKRITPFFCYRSMICHQAMVFSKNCFLNHQYDISYRIAADREYLCWIVLKSRMIKKYLPLTIARYQGNGFSESEKNSLILKQENQRIKKEYFSLKEQLVFGAFLFFTFPTIRKKIVKNPVLLKHYKKLVEQIYRLNFTS